MPKLNGKEYTIATTTPNAIQKLDKADDLLREFNEKNNRNYLFDAEFRGKLLRKVASIVMDFEDGVPSKEFFEDGDLDVGKIQNARINFLGNGGMIRM